MIDTLVLILTMECLLAMNESTDTHNTQMNLLQTVEWKKKIPENYV